MSRASSVFGHKSDLAIELLVLISSITPLFHDWKVIILFCSTLHKVQEYAALRGDALPESHKERRRYIEDNLPEMAEAYKALLNVSMVARYVPYTAIASRHVKKAKDLRAHILSFMS